MYFENIYPILPTPSITTLSTLSCHTTLKLIFSSSPLNSVCIAKLILGTGSLLVYSQPTGVTSWTHHERKLISLISATVNAAISSASGGIFVWKTVSLMFSLPFGCGKFRRQSLIGGSRSLGGWWWVVVCGVGGGGWGGWWWVVWVVMGGGGGWWWVGWVVVCRMGGLGSGGWWWVVVVRRVVWESLWPGSSSCTLCQYVL